MPLPTHYEYLLMSHLAYSLCENIQHLTNTEPDTTSLLEHSHPISILELRNIDTKAQHYLHNKNWEVLPAWLLKDIAQFEAYFAGVFINHISCQIVIAHRGTLLSFIDNLKVDLHILCTDQLVYEQQFKAYTSNLIRFITSVVKYRNLRYQNYQISQTGHSLGGFAAEIGAIYFSYPQHLVSSFDLDRLLEPLPERDRNAVTFDTLGASRIASRMFNSDISRQAIVNYIVLPNLANTANIPAGIRRVLPSITNNRDSFLQIKTLTPEYSQANLINLKEFIINHRIESFFEYFDDISGSPFFYYEVNAFPRATNSLVSFQGPQGFEQDWEKNLNYMIQCFMKLSFGEVFYINHILIGAIVPTRMIFCDTRHRNQIIQMFQWVNADVRITDEGTDRILTPAIVLGRSISADSESRAQPLVTTNVPGVNPPIVTSSSFFRPDSRTSDGQSHGTAPDFIPQ